MVNRDILKSELAATPDCLSLDELSQLSAEQVEAHSHVSGCARCQTEMALLRKFESDEPVPGEGAAVAWVSAQLERRLNDIKNPALASRRREIDADQSHSWFKRLFALPGFRLTAPIAGAAVVAAVALGIGITALVGLFFGLYPAMKASSLPL